MNSGSIARRVRSSTPSRAAARNGRRASSSPEPQEHQRADERVFAVPRRLFQPRLSHGHIAEPSQCQRQSTAHLPARRDPVQRSQDGSRAVDVGHDQVRTISLQTRGQDGHNYRVPNARKRLRFPAKSRHCTLRSELLRVQAFDRNPLPCMGLPRFPDSSHPTPSELADKEEVVYRHPWVKR